MTGWELPRQTRIGGSIYQLNTDYRQILKIFTYLQDENLPEFVRWHVALGLFYDAQIPDEDLQEAIRYFCCFVNCGMEDTDTPATPLISWEQEYCRRNPKRIKLQRTYTPGEQAERQRLRELLEQKPHSSGCI